ncbi:MAG: UDP-N-acetylmuramoyl-tripeptide--D-alanyl-D-alanine ligase [Spirochaetes bacterium]|nr:UDP-N-acetylmuramoyl-tripeptide--D-alanyl-D-alanine ligase [Spirochaetota bacterium]
MATKEYLMNFSHLVAALQADSPPGSPGAELHSFSKEGGFSSVSVDSRKVEEGGLFVALSGEATDGHLYIEAALKAGAAGVIAQVPKLEKHGVLKMCEKAGASVIAVQDSLFALQEAARVYLQKFPRLLKIGITGSAGKTTTKEIAAAIIGLEKNTVMSAGNLNSETGLPLSIFTVRNEHEAGVFELAMNHKGEMEALARILRPNIALITNIGRAHIGLLGSQDAIAFEKKCIFSYLSDKDIALIPNDDGYRDFLARDTAGIVRFYGAESFAEYEGVKSLGLFGSEVGWAGQTMRFSLPGRHSLANMFAAAAIAKEAGISAEAIKQGVESVRPMFGRTEVFTGRATVIRDCYNASPESVGKALDFADNLEWPGRRIYIMADMLELGGQSKEAHAELGRRLLESKAGDIFLFGKETAFAAQVLEEAGRGFFYTGDFDELYRQVSAALENSSPQRELVLLKGSRGCALERLSGILTGEGGGNLPGAHNGA